MVNLTCLWYQKSVHPFLFFLLPFSWLFRIIIDLRAFFYRIGLFKIKRLSIPVIVVGNISVGGTGKTPMVIWLAQFLKQQGYRPGIVSRGVGGEKHLSPYQVKESDAVKKVGDEALLLVKKSNCPVVVGIDRAKAASHLQTVLDCTIIISDDGLQHYALDRDIEILMIDSIRQFGNRQLLPAGPLRELPKRLKSVDFIVYNGNREKCASETLQDNRALNLNLQSFGKLLNQFSMLIEPDAFVSIKDKIEKKWLDFPVRKIHAVAAIGNPQRFFNLLTQSGFSIIPHVFPDHYHYCLQDFDFSEKLPIIMTEKDAVKCFNFAESTYWYLKVNVKLDEKFAQVLLMKLKK